MDRASEFIPIDQSRKPPLLRKIFDKAVNTISPHEVVHVSPDGQARATELVKNGGGLILAYTHLSGREGQDILAFLSGQPEFNNKEIYSPVSFHTFNKNILSKLGYQIGAKMAKAKLQTVVTPETMSIEGISEKGAFANKGLKEFLLTAGEILNNNGIVPVALQAEGNTGILGDPTPALSALVEITQKKHPNCKFGVLFVGLEFPESEGKDVSMQGKDNVSKMHIGEKIQLKIGNFFTAQEARQTAESDDSPIVVKDKKIRKMDSWAFKQLASLLSPNKLSPQYLPQG